MRWTLLLGAAWYLAAQPADYDRARQLLSSGHLREAVSLYRDLARAHPNDPGTLLNLSIAEYKAGDFGDAAASAAAALKLDPDLVPAHLFRGASYLELGEFAAAVEPLRRATSANPAERNGRLMLGEALLGAGQPEAALEQLQSAAGMLPANPRVWYGLGRAYQALGRVKDEEEAWGRLEALPPSLESHLHAADVETRQQRWLPATAQWRQALDMAPQNRSIRLGLAWSLFRSRDYDGTMAALKPVLSGPDANVQFLWGASLLNLQQPAESIPFLKAALSADSALLSARAALGQALLQTGKTGEAIAFLKDALPLDQDGSIHFQLFRAYQLTGHKAEAEQTLAGYQRLRASLPTAP
ncbi:MAG: tetratricopeptide repeat protein [Acidobacteriota bacterium]|nr:tetratricopeptide repeat protein [Acidobacteriota bacterium]